MDENNQFIYNEKQIIIHNSRHSLHIENRICHLFYRIGAYKNGILTPQMCSNRHSRIL